jgi:hypothetical protein
VPPDAERRGRAIPPALQRIIDRCLGGHGRYYPTMAALADDLSRQDAADVEPRRAFGRRPRVLAVLAASVALVTGILWFGWTRMRTESTEARSEVGTGTLEMVPDSQPPPANGPRPADSTTAANKAGRRADSVPATTKVGRSADSVAAPNQGSRRADSTPVATSRPPSASQRPADSSAVGVGVARPRARETSVTLSPFRRSHPWAAEPKGRVYFPSSCPQALGARDLLYFRTEAEARATGRSRSPDPSCH